MPEEARVVRQVFDWVGRERLTIGEVCRRLTRAGELTRTGKTVWDRSVVWGMLKNPAYMGTAAFGKTRQEPPRPRLRAQRGRPLQPRRAVSTGGDASEEWITIPVPAIVEPEVFAAVQEQLRDNQRHARQSRRGASICSKAWSVPAVWVCLLRQTASAPRPPKASRARMPITAAWGRMRIALAANASVSNTQVRTDLLDLAVWREV